MKKALMIKMISMKKSSYGKQMRQKIKTKTTLKIKLLRIHITRGKEEVEDRIQTRNPIKMTFKNKFKQAHLTKKKAFSVKMKSKN